MARITLTAEEYENLLLHEEYLEEKLIVIGKGANYGQVVFLAGGAGSGKGFSLGNYMDANKFKVRDVDEWKSAFMKLDGIRKDASKVQKGVSGTELRKKAVMNYAKSHANDPEGTSPSIPQMPTKDLDELDLRNADDVFTLHNLVDNLGIKDKTLNYLLGGAKSRDRLPNIVFDVTLKNTRNMNEAVSQLLSVGYQPENIHIVWVLSDYDFAVQANMERNRRVPSKILLQTHEGAARTMSDIVRGNIPKNVNGGVYVILGKSTVYWTDKKGNEIKVTPKFNNPKNRSFPVVKGFTYLKVKEAGKRFIADKEIQKKLNDWMGDRIPPSVRQEIKRKELKA